MCLLEIVQRSVTIADEIKIAPVCSSLFVEYLSGRDKYFYIQVKGKEDFVSMNSNSIDLKWVNIVCRRFPSPFYRQPPFMAILLLYIFSKPPTFGNISIDNIVPMIYKINTKINSRGRLISSCFEDYKTTLHPFFCKQHFYMLHQTEIWFETITVSCFKGFQRKINIVNGRLADKKSIIAKKSIHNY